ncbi:hypothetical protein ACROYT_G021838 [Oculina patagonica]
MRSFLWSIARKAFMCHVRRKKKESPESTTPSCFVIKQMQMASPGINSLKKKESSDNGFLLCVTKGTLIPGQKVPGRFAVIVFFLNSWIAGFVTKLLLKADAIPLRQVVSTPDKLDNAPKLKRNLPTSNESSKMTVLVEYTTLKRPSRAVPQYYKSGILKRCKTVLGIRLLLICLNSNKEISSLSQESKSKLMPLVVQSGFHPWILQVDLIRLPWMMKTDARLPSRHHLESLSTTGCP